MKRSTVVLLTFAVKLWLRSNGSCTLMYGEIFVRSDFSLTSIIVAVRVQITMFDAVDEKRKFE